MVDPKNAWSFPYPRRPNSFTISRSSDDENMLGIKNPNMVEAPETILLLLYYSTKYSSEDAKLIEYAVEFNLTGCHGTMICTKKD